MYPAERNRPRPAGRPSLSLRLLCSRPNSRTHVISTGPGRSRLGASDAKLVGRRVVDGSGTGREAVVAVEEELGKQTEPRGAGKASNAVAWSRACLLLGSRSLCLLPAFLSVACGCDTIDPIGNSLDLTCGRAQPRPLGRIDLASQPPSPTATVQAAAQRSSIRSLIITSS